MDRGAIAVKDLDLSRRAILARDGEGAKDRVTVLPDRLVAALRCHLHDTEHLQRVDLDVSTTMIYTHVLNRGGRGVVSPLDRLARTGSCETTKGMLMGDHSLRLVDLRAVPLAVT
jgi:hypothetical protein